MEGSKKPILIILIIGFLLFIAISNLTSIDYKIIKEGDVQRNIKAGISYFIWLLPLIFFAFVIPKELKEKKVKEIIRLFIQIPIFYVVYIIVSTGVIISPLCSFVDSYTVSRIHTSSIFNEHVTNKESYNSHGIKYHIELLSTPIHKTITINCDSITYSNIVVGDSLTIKYYYSDGGILINEKVNH